MGTPATVHQHHGEIGRAILVEGRERHHPLVGQAGALDVDRMVDQPGVGEQRLEPPEVAADLHERQSFGIVDLLAILPTYLIAFFPAARYLIVVRVLRLLRAFRVLKLAAYVRESDLLMRSLSASRRKITAFLFAIFAMTLILGSLMYLIEGEEHGFTSIPRGVYWAIVTLTTVGYGDISPETPLGQLVAALVMVMGYGVIAVPTGIVSAEMAVAATERRRALACQACGTADHPTGARFCHGCGEQLEPTA